MATRINEDTKTVSFDSTDLPGMIHLMDRHAEFDEMLFGRTEDNEDMHISINKDNITTTVFQNNHWIRRNVYYRDGTSEELFDGKW